MYVVVQHRLRNPDVALARGQKLLTGDGAPAGARNLQFLPSRDASAVTCLWEARSVSDIQTYVDGVLGDASENLCYEVDAEQAFAEQPAGIPAAQEVGR